MGLFDENLEKIFQYRSPFKGLFDEDVEMNPIPATIKRYIPKTPYKVLDAPSL